jgi:hypothetical protein
MKTFFSRIFNFLLKPMFQMGIWTAAVLLSLPAFAQQTLTPSAVSFGSQTINTTGPASTLTFSNPTATTHPTLDIVHPPWIVASTTCPLSLTANLTCTISVACRPTAEGALASTVNVIAGSINIASAMTCSGVDPGAVTLSPGSATFGNVVVNTQSAPQVFTVTNGSSSLRTLAISVAPGFQYTTTCLSSLPGGSSCQISVRLSPTSVQAYSGVLTVQSGVPLQAPNATATAGLSGFGIAASQPQPIGTVSLSPSSADFGAVTINGTSGSRNFTLSNTTANTVAITAITVAPGFSMTQNGCGTTIAASASCILSVAFRPTLAQVYSGALTVVVGSQTLNAGLAGIGTTAPNVGPAGQLSDVSPKRISVSSASDTVASVLYAFANGVSAAAPGNAVFCLELTAPLPASSATSSYPCVSGSEFARHPNTAAQFQTTAVAGLVRSAREPITIPSLVTRFAEQQGKREFYFVRSMAGGQFAVVTLQNLGNSAILPLTLTSAKLQFRGYESAPIFFTRRGQTLPEIEAVMDYVGSGWLRGAWEIVQPGDPEPTPRDLLPEANLPLEQRGLQRRYPIVGNFSQYLPANGRIVLTPPDMSRLPVAVDGAYRVVLRLFAEPSIAGGGDAALIGGAASFSLPTLRYFVGSGRTEQAGMAIPDVSVVAPLAGYGFGRNEPVRFAWQSRAGASAYLLEAVAKDGSVVASAELPATAVSLASTYEAPAPWRDKAKGRAERWRVSAIGDDGRLLAQSRWLTFSIQ